MSFLKKFLIALALISVLTFIIGMIFYPNKVGGYFVRYILYKAPIHVSIDDSDYYYRGWNTVYTFTCYSPCYSDVLLKLEDADANTFRVIIGQNNRRLNYAKDKNHVYYENHIIKEADITTFTVMEAQDYIRQKISATHEDVNLPETYAFDKNNIYRYGKLIEKNDTTQLEIFDQVRNNKPFYLK